MEIKRIATNYVQPEQTTEKKAIPGSSQSQVSDQIERGDQSSNPFNNPLDVPSFNDGIGGGHITAETPGQSQESDSKESDGLESKNPFNDSQTEDNGVGLEYFDRNSRIAGLFNSTYIEDAQQKEDSLFGTDPFEATPTTVSRGFGKNEVSKRDQYSDGGGDAGETSETNDSDPVYDSQGNYVGTRGELNKMAEEQNGEASGGNDTGGTSSQTMLEGEYATLTDEEKAAYQKENQEFRNAFVKDESEARKLSNEQWRQSLEMDRNGYGGFGFATPHPDDVDDSHVPKSIQTKKERIDPEKAEATRKRQVTLGNENKTEREKVHVNKREMANAMVGKRTANNSTPVPDAVGNDTSGGDPGSPYTVDLQEIHKKGDPPDGDGGSQTGQ